MVKIGHPVIPPRFTKTRANRAELLTISVIAYTVPRVDFRSGDKSCESSRILNNLLPQLLPSANRLVPFRRFDFAGDDSRRIELNREVTQTNRLSLLSRLKNEEGSCVDFLMGLRVTWCVSTP